LAQKQKYIDWQRDIILSPVKFTGKMMAPGIKNARVFL
jgi:hypothetical protein